MSFSIQTNVNALVAQQNLSVNGAFQSRTIQRLTSGYRINSSADDAAGLAVANRFRSDTVELQQGVRNANDGVSQLQIIDGGLSNISQMLDRMKTLATQSASSGFTGDRTTLNNEYTQLLSEIDRQAQNIGLNNGGSLNKSLSVYLGGAHQSNTSGSGTVTVDLSLKTVDQAGLSLTGSSVGGGAGSGAVDMALGGAGKRLDDPGATFLAAGSQAFTFNYVDSSGAAQSRVVTVNGGSGSITGAAVISQLNTGLAGTGLTAAIETATANAGQLSISGTNGFTVYAAAKTAGNGITTDGNTAVNTAQYNLTTVGGALGGFAAAGGGDHETFVVSDGTNKAVITLDSTNASGTSAAAIATVINNALKAGTAISGTGTGGTARVNVTAIAGANDTKISFQSSGSFTVDETLHTINNGANLLFALGSQQVNAATGGSGSGATANATAALGLINSAVATLGSVQGVVGAGQNKLNYAISLAQSQISGYTAAESQIRDADIASEAANLTKSSVLQQATIAAMAQANSAPQAVLALLRG